MNEKVRSNGAMILTRENINIEGKTPVPGPPFPTQIT
jgi:hypothetical protein